MITRLEDFVKYKLNESTSTGGRTLVDYFKEKGITLVEQRELATLNCSGNNLTSLEGIENLTKLTYLNCSGNQLTSLEGIENCPNLTYLYCNDNVLVSLKGIENCPNLTYLYCNDNVLASLEGIENLTNLTVLRCFSNNLTSLKGIENCTKLTYLNCRHNNLTSLEGIENLTKLTELNCSGNDLPFNNYNYMTTKEVRDSFYLIKHELEISSILCNLTDDYDIDRYGFRYEFNDEIFIEDLLKELKVISKKLNMIGIYCYVNIGEKSYSIADLTKVLSSRSLVSQKYTLTLYKLIN